MEGTRLSQPRPCGRKGLDVSMSRFRHWASLTLPPGELRQEMEVEGMQWLMSLEPPVPLWPCRTAGLYCVPHPGFQEGSLVRWSLRQACGDSASEAA